MLKELSLLFFFLTFPLKGDLKYLIPKCDDCPPDELIWELPPGTHYRIDSSPDLKNWDLGKVLQAQDIIVKQPLSTRPGRNLYYRIALIDLTPPVILERFPTDKSFGIRKDQPIVINLEDESGIDPDSIVLSVGPYQNIRIGPGLDFTDGILTFTPPEEGLGNFGEVIDVSLTVADRKGNKSETPEVWEFELATEIIPREDLFVFGSPEAQEFGQSINEKDLDLLDYLGRKPDRKNPGQWTLAIVDEDRIEIHSATRDPLQSLINRLKVGQAIVNTETVEVDKQFFREITRISDIVQDDDKLWKVGLATVDIPFEECFEQVSFSLDQTAKTLRVEKGQIIVPEPEIGRRLRIGIDVQGSRNLFNFSRDWSNLEFFTENDNISLTFDELGFSANVRGSAHVKYHLGGSDNKMRASLTASAQAACKPVFTIDYKGSPVDINKSVIPKTTLATTVIPIGPISIPVKLSFETRLKANVDVDFKGTIRGGFTFDKEITYFYEWRQGSSPNRGKVISGDGFQKIPLTIDAKGTLAAGVSLVPTLELSIGGDFIKNKKGKVLLGASAGVKGSIIAHAKLEAEASSRISPTGTTFSANTCLEAGLGYDVDAFYYITLDVPGERWDVFLDGTLDLIDGEFFTPLRWCWDYSEVIEWEDFENVVVGVVEGILDNNFLVTPPGPFPGDLEGVSYQWLKDGTPIPGQTSPTLELDGATLFHSGDYQLEATHKGVRRMSRKVPVKVVEELDPTPGNEK